MTTWKPPPEGIWKHRWVRTPLREWREGNATYYQHPGERNPDHCEMCNVSWTFENREADCPETLDIGSKHYVHLNSW